MAEKTPSKSLENLTTAETLDTYHFGSIAYEALKNGDRGTTTAAADLLNEVIGRIDPYTAALHKDGRDNPVNVVNMANNKYTEAFKEATLGDLYGHFNQDKYGVGDQFTRSQQKVMGAGLEPYFGQTLEQLIKAEKEARESMEKLLENAGRTGSKTIRDLRSKLNELTEAKGTYLQLAKMHMYGANAQVNNRRSENEMASLKNDLISTLKAA